MRRTLAAGMLLVACKGSGDAPSAAITATPPPPPADAAGGEVRMYAGSIADLDGDGTLELAAGGFAAANGRRRATVFVYRRTGDAWTPVTEGGWLGGGGGNGSLVRNIEIADLDGDGRPEIIALGRVGSKTQAASARLVVLALRGGTLREVAKAEWNTATYTHGYGLAVGDLDGDARPEIVTTGFAAHGSPAREHGFVRVWSRELALRAETRIAGTGSASARINDVAIGDLDGDGRPEIVTAGRTGAAHADDDRRGDARDEHGDLAVFDPATLALRARLRWREGATLRLRTLAIAELDGSGPAELVAGGQVGDQPCLAVFALAGDALAQRAYAAGPSAGETRDVLVAGTRIVATGPRDLATWRFADGALSRETTTAVDAHARAAVLAPDGSVLTVGRLAP